MSKPITPGIYLHYKGGKYEVLFTAKHSETLEELVVYKALYNNDVSKLWVRPATMFFELVEVQGELVPRFSGINLSVSP